LHKNLFMVWIVCIFETACQLQIEPQIQMDFCKQWVYIHYNRTANIFHEYFYEYCKLCRTDSNKNQDISNFWIR